MIRWFRLWMFVRSLPLVTVARAVKKHVTGTEDATLPSFMDETPLTSAQINTIVSRCVHNHRHILAVAKAYGIASTIVIQPHPAYKYDLACHEALIPGRGLMGNQRAGDGYPALLRAIRNASFYGTSLLDLSGVQEGRKENLYLDEAHYSAAFSRDLARMLAEALTKNEGWR